MEFQVHNTEGNLPTQMFIYFQGFTRIDDFFMVRIKGVTYMIKDHNFVPNQEARLGTIQQLNLQALVWWMRIAIVVSL